MEIVPKRKSKYIRYISNCKVKILYLCPVFHNCRTTASRIQLIYLEKSFKDNGLTGC